MNHAALVHKIQAKMTGLLGIYAFGSRIHGDATPQSDLDLAILVEGYAAPLALWELASDLEELAGCPVDLLDLRAATTVMQYQVITSGQRWWKKDSQADFFEAAILSEKTELDTARAGLLDDIKHQGTVYAR